MGQSMKETINN